MIHRQNLLIIFLNSLLMRKKKDEAPTKPAEPSDEVKLLTEIRDELKKK